MDKCIICFEENNNLIKCNTCVCISCDKCIKEYHIHTFHKKCPACRQDFYNNYNTSTIELVNIPGPPRLVRTPNYRLPVGASIRAGNYENYNTILNANYRRLGFRGLVYN